MRGRVTFAGRLLAARELDPRTHGFRGAAVAAAMAGFAVLAAEAARDSDEPGRVMLNALLLTDVAAVIPLCGLLGVAAVRRERRDGRLAMLALAEPRGWPLGLNLLLPAWTAAALAVWLQLPVALMAVVFGGVTAGQAAGGLLLVSGGAVAASGVGASVAVSVRGGTLASVLTVGACVFAVVMAAVALTPAAGSTRLVVFTGGVLLATCLLAAVGLAMEAGRELLRHPEWLHEAGPAGAAPRRRASRGVGNAGAFAWKSRRFEFPDTAVALGVACALVAVPFAVAVLFRGRGDTAFGAALTMIAAVVGGGLTSFAAARRLAVDGPAGQGELLALLPGGPARTFRKSRRVERELMRWTWCGCVLGLLLSLFAAGAGVFLLYPTLVVPYAVAPAGAWVAARATGVLGARLGAGAGFVAGVGLAAAAAFAGGSAAAAVFPDSSWKGRHGYPAVVAAAGVSVAPLLAAAAVLRPRESDDPWLDPTPRRWLRRYGPR